VRHDLPSGTVTFLFSDVEGSTRLLHELGARRYEEALVEHRRVLRAAFSTNGGVEVDTQGDAFFVAFPTAPGAIAAASDARQGLAAGPVRVRIGIHTGTPYVGREGYVGVDVHRAARIAACGHGGQVLVSASTAALVGTDGLRDLGEHRLKDLSAPERIYQLGEADFPPLESLHRTNLPIPSTPFLGRELELSEVVALVLREDVRIATLTGPGGTGKTRLGLQAAADLAAHFRDGVWWVPLASLRTPALVLSTVGQAIGAGDDVAAHIADRSLLLLLDNFEQVVDAAADLAELVATCPELKLLVTSREPLRASGEHEYPVHGLAHEESVDLFLARARAFEPGFTPDEAVSEICRRLDELPLAIELAAARVSALSTTQILERLERRLPLLTRGPRDLPERQRTLRATLEWSHELLTEDEQRLFARLAVFSGGCDLQSAESVAAADVDTLQSLVDKSLVRHTDERFWMLETTREYAAECLARSADVIEVERRHAEHFLALAEEAAPQLRWTGSPGDWLDRLEREHDNLRAALDRLASTGETQLALQLAGALYRFWVMRGHLAEGGRRLEAALAADERPTPARARALDGAAVIALGDDIATARLRAEEALALYRALDDEPGTAYATLALGEILGDEGELRAALELFDESLRRFRALGDEHYALLALQGLAGAHEDLGDLERARSLHEETLRGARAQSDRRLVARALGQLAPYASRDGRSDDALAMLKESVEILVELDHRLGVAEDLARIALALSHAGRSVDAVRLASASEALFDETGREVPSWVAHRNAETLAAGRAALDDTAFTDACEQGRALTFDEAVARALEA
jgi:predicted ATPase/class 3 adenylate cyclase